MAQKLYTAIVFMLDGSAPRKYRNINNIPNFLNYCNKINSNYIPKKGRARQGASFLFLYRFKT
jgi:hypothetical protein